MADSLTKFYGPDLTAISDALAALVAAVEAIETVLSWENLAPEPPSDPMTWRSGEIPGFVDPGWIVMNEGDPNHPGRAFEVGAVPPDFADVDLAGLHRICLMQRAIEPEGPPSSGYYANAVGTDWPGLWFEWFKGATFADHQAAMQVLLDWIADWPQPTVDNEAIADELTAAREAAAALLKAWDESKIKKWAARGGRRTPRRFGV